MERLVYRPTFVRILSVILWVVLAYMAATTLWDDLGNGLRWTGVLAFVAAGVYVMFWRPSVEVDGHGVTVRNLVRDVVVPWPRLDVVDTRYSLVIEAEDRRYSAWAAPAPGRATALRQSRKETAALAAMGSDLRHGLRASATPSSDSGGAAIMVKAAWERAMASSRQTREEADPVVRSWAVLPAVAVGVTAVAAAAALVV